MSFLDRFRKNKHEDDGVFVHENVEMMDINLVDLARKLVYDYGINDAEAVMEMMGFPRQSSEVSDMSERDSAARIQQLDPIIPLIGLLAGALNGAIISAYIEKDTDPKVVKQLMVASGKQIIQTVVAVLANLVDLGVVDVGHTTVTHIMSKDGVMNVGFDDEDDDDDEEEDD